jgi:ATP-binding cassette subfamily G (WHITE) protein 5 (sterolin 1)
MITSEYVLELSNVFHSGQVETGSCLQKMIGTVRTGVILKDVSIEIHGGELSAVLGSKGNSYSSSVGALSGRV